MEIKRIETENYDCAYHVDEEPHGVKDFPLIDGKLFTSEKHEWILLDNFGVEIITDASYDDGDLGEHSEKALELIKYLIEDAPKKGYVEDADIKDINRICKLLGEEIPQFVEVGLTADKIQDAIDNGELDMNKDEQSRGQEK